jgi:hypothetical protein
MDGDYRMDAAGDGTPDDGLVTVVTKFARNGSASRVDRGEAFEALSETWGKLFKCSLRLSMVSLVQKSG